MKYLVMITLAFFGAQAAPIDKAKNAPEQTVVDSALVTVIEEAEIPAKVEGVLAAVAGGLRASAATN